MLKAQVKPGELIREVYQDRSQVFCDKGHS